MKYKDSLMFEAVAQAPAAFLLTLVNKQTIAFMWVHKAASTLTCQLLFVGTVSSLISHQRKATGCSNVFANIIKNMQLQAFILYIWRCVLISLLRSQPGAHINNFLIQSMKMLRKNCTKLLLNSSRHLSNYSDE